MKPLTESSLGGLLLFTGAIIILVTIFFEYQIGWIGVERSEADVPVFMYENWSGLKSIWGWQALGYIFFIVAFLLLQKNTTLIKRVVWFVLAICALLVVVAYGLTLGAYYPALEVYGTQPAIFQSVRGGVGSLYSSGLMGLVIIALFFIYECFAKSGVVDRSTGIGIILLFVASILIGTFTPLSLKVTGATVFLFPLMLGYFFWRRTD